jgi:hypothetical protein
MNETRRVFLAVTAALCVVAVGLTLTFASGPDDKHGPGSAACKQAHEQGLCQKDNPGEGCKGHGGGHGTVEGAQYTVTNTENGVTIVITSDDPAVVKLIQARYAQFPEWNGHERGSEACSKAHEEGRCKKDAAPDTGKDAAPDTGA